MGLMDVLGRYAENPNRPPPQVFDDFDSVAREAPEDDIGDGLEEAFRSEATPPFEQMVGQLFDRSGPEERAGLLNEILGSLGGGTGGALASGALGGLLRNAGRGSQISPGDTRTIPVSEVESATAQAARENPGLISKLSRFYARHPQLVHNLGNAALAIAMGRMARRRRML